MSCSLSQKGYGPTGPQNLDGDFAHPRAESFFLLEFVYGDGGAPEINLFTVSETTNNTGDVADDGGDGVGQGGYDCMLMMM